MIFTCLAPCFLALGPALCSAVAPSGYTVRFAPQDSGSNSLRFLEANHNEHIGAAESAAFSRLQGPESNASTRGASGSVARRSNDKILTAATYCDEYPCISVGGVKFAEPVTAVTDYILFVELFFIGLAMLRHSMTSSCGQSGKFWACSYLTLGLSCAVGGTNHGFAIQMNCEGQDVCMPAPKMQVGMLLTQMLAFALALVGTAHLVLKQGFGLQALTCMAVVNTLAYSLFLLVGVFVPSISGLTLSFQLAFLFDAPCIFAILVLFSMVAIYKYGGTCPAGSCTTLAGWLVCIGAMAFQASGIRVNKWFNYNDIFHVILIFGSGMTGHGLKQWFSSLSAVDHLARAGGEVTTVLASKKLSGAVEKRFTNH